jgi:site-specific recombinase XerD
MNGEDAGINSIAMPDRAAGKGADAPRSPRAAAAAKSPTGTRKLHMGHFAFMRAVIQGLDTRDSWDRYLRIDGAHDDLRNVNRTIAWVRDEFAAAARRSDRHGTARLVRIDARRIAEREPSLPTLEEFALQHGLEDFAQHEQLERYRAHYGKPTTRQSRRGRLIAKQLDALNWLERLVAQPPQLGDAAAAWLHPDLATRLEHAGIFTIRQLIDRINGLGMRWWGGIRAIGAAKAERIEEWLTAHEATIGVGIGAHVRVKRSSLHSHQLERVVPRATAIVPIEKFIVPPELNGSDGLYRAPQRLCMLAAKNDSEAVLTWVKAKQGLSDEQKAVLKRKRGVDPTAPEGPMAWLWYLSNTQRAYLKEAERFMLWAIVQRKKPLSSMTTDDCEAYRSFLANPAPVDRWCGPRGRERWSPLWRPFEGPLSPHAQRQAVTILKSLYKFLVDQCYLIGNPWHGVDIPKAVGARIDKGRSFTRAQWRFIEAQLGLLPDTSAHRRLRFALHLLYATGLRLAEVVAARVDDLNWVAYPPEDDDEPVEGWELKVIGKAEKARLVPVPLDVIGELSQYLVSRGLDPDPQHALNRSAYLLGKAVDVDERAPWSPTNIRQADPKAGVTAGRVYKVLKAFFTDCASVLAMTDPTGAERLAAASTHWLRHTHGSHAVAAGTPLEVLQQNLGHASLNTMTIYVTSEHRRRMKAQQNFWDTTRHGSDG